VADGAHPGAAPAAWFDVAVTDARELQRVVARIRQRPLASLALVQLLRGCEGRTLHEGLLAESLVYSTLQAGPEFHEWLARRRPPKPRPAPAGPAVRVAREGARLTLTLNRPDKHNAFSTAMRDALCEGLTVALADESIAEIVLSGAGPSFCSGGDLDEFGTLPDPATAHAVRATRNPARLLSECAARVHARVHGACVGAGVELPAFAGRVTAAPDARFELPEVSMGLVPGAGGTASLPRRIGRQRAAWLALTGSALDAGTALAWGLVDEVAT
jgi:enoyl-CoA hydratase/carnithine racemase